MNEGISRKFWDLVRPIHAPITRRIRRRLGRNYFAHPEMELPPPYEAIQLDVERHLHRYLHVAPADVSRIVIVGAHEADEIPRLRSVYPRAHFLCFEPNPDSYQRLTRQFGSNHQVEVRNLALGDAPGKARFYELDMPGNGSLLEPDLEDWARFTEWRKKGAVEFDVMVSTLDDEVKDMADVDLLWIDVQGAEASVLAGGKDTLKRCKAIFVEVSLVRSPYKGTRLFSEISATLQSAGFLCVGMGADARTGAANALLVRNFDKLVFR